MGQRNTHTNTKDSVFANFDSLALSRDKTSFFNNGSSVYAASAVVEDRGCFSYRCCSSKKPDIATSRWKSHMVEQLKSSTLDVWPKLLIKVLKNYKDKGAENNYQAEVLMAHKHYLSLGFKTKDDSLVSVFSKQKDDSFYGKMSGENSFQFSEESNPNHDMVQELLSNCPLLEEKVYDKRQKETWIDKSFNIKVPEATEAMNKSLEKFEAVRKVEITSANPSHNKRLSPKKKTSHTKRYIEKYKNNTFITRLQNRQEQNEADMMYHMVLKYKAVTDTIDRHVKQPQHIFYRLISRFERFYYQAYFPIIEKWRSKQISEAQFDAYCERATADLQQFIKILAEGVSWFYRLDYFQSESEALNGDSLFNNDNLMSLITSIVFTETIYITLFDLYKLKESKVEELYQKNIKYCKKLNPQDFGTADEYCLNEKTIAYFEKKNINHLRNSRSKDLLGPISSSSYDRKAINKTDSSYSGGGSFPKKFSSPIKMYVGSLDSRNLNVFSEENEAMAQIPEKFTPYEDAIDMLSTLKYRKNPIQKLKTIVKVAELLTESIENFYGEIGFHRRDKLDADQTLSIFMYLVSRSNLDNLIVNCKIIQEFSTPNILNSVSGYYAITLEACIRCICAMTFQDRVTSDYLSICLKGFVNSVSRASVSLEK